MCGIMAVILISFILDNLAPRTSFMQISSAIHDLPYFLLGLLYCDYKRPIDIWVRKFWYIIFPVFVVISVSIVSNSYIAALSGIIFSVTIALIFEKKCPDKLVKLSSLCYVVYLLSYFPQMLIRGPIAHFFPLVNQYVLSVISFFLGLLLPLIFGLVFIRTKVENGIINKLGLLIGL